MTPGGALKAAAAGLLALTTLGLALGSFHALQTGVTALPFDGKIEMAAGYDRRAVSLVLKADRSVADLSSANQLSAKALEQYPYDIGAILRQAQIETLLHDRLTPYAIARLRTSYELAEIDPSLASWRVPFCLAHWGLLPDDLRHLVEQEFMTVGRDKVFLKAIRDQVAASGPGPGQLVTLIWSSRLRR